MTTPLPDSRIAEIEESIKYRNGLLTRFGDHTQQRANELNYNAAFLLDSIPELISEIRRLKAEKEKVEEMLLKMYYETGEPEVAEIAQDYLISHNLIKADN